MKILLLLSSLDRGGAETHLLSLATSLTRGGHSITVISSGGSLVESLRREGIDHQILPLHSHSPLAWIRSYYSLKRMLRRTRYDIIHAHSRIPALLVCRLARKNQISFLTTVHAFFRVNRWFRRYSRWGEYSIAVSEDLKQYLCENYDCSSERIAVIPNGIDTTHFSPDPNAPSFVSHRLLYVSRLDEDCAEVAFLLCRLAPKLKERFPDLQIVFVGGGSALDSLQQLAKNINAAEQPPLLLFRGYLSDVRDEYRRAQAVLGVSRVALEAMACGVPVILAGNEGFGGLLRPPAFECASSTNFCCRGQKKVTEALLYEAILASFSMSREDRTSLTAQLIQSVRRFCDIQSVTEQTISVYEKLLNERRTRGGAVVLCGYYGYGNTGDHALLRAAAQRVCVKFPNVSFCAFTAHGQKDEPLFGIRCLRRTRPLLVLKTIRSSKTLVFGGGTLLQDRTSLRSLCYYVFLLRYAQRHGISTELWANGLALPRTPLARHLLSRALLPCTHIGLRDQVSLSFAQELCGKTERIVLESDLAERVSAASDARISFLQRHYRLWKEDGTLRPYAIVAPRGREKRGQIRILSWWLGRLRNQGILPIFVPLFPKEDEFLCQKLAYEFGGRIARGLSEGDLVGLMKQCSCVGSMRLHALVFARRAKTSFVGFGEDPKIEIYCCEHGGYYWTDTLKEE